jgi:hypothetical protein
MTDRTWKITYQTRFKDETDPEHPKDMVQVILQTEIGFVKSFFVTAEEWKPENYERIIAQKLKDPRLKVIE